MAIGTGLALAGGLLGAFGAKEQADAQRDAASQAAQAAEFRPFDIGGSLGNVNFLPGDRVNARFTSEQQRQRNLLGQLFQRQMTGQTPTAGFQQFAGGLGTGAIPGLFQGAQMASQQLPTGAFAQQQGLTTQLSDLASRQAAGLLGQAGADRNADLARLLTGQGLGATGRALSGVGQTRFDPTQAQGFLQNAAGLNMSAAEGLLSRAGQSINPSAARGLVSQAQGSITGIPTDTQSMVSERLNLLREQAAPQEQRQLEELENRLFAQGRLDSTGGDRAMEAFARGLGQADLQRQLSAQDLGLRTQQQLANIGLGQAGAFQGLAGTTQNIGTSTAGALGGLAGQSGGLALRQAGLFGNLANQAAGLEQIGANLGLQRASQQAQIGQGLLGQGAGFQGLDVQRQANLLGAGQGLLGVGANVAAQGFQGATDFSNLMSNRANQRLAQAQQLFGFGNQLGAQDFNRGLSALQGQQTIDQQLRNLIALGGNLGGQGANAGYAQSQALLQQGDSPVGGLLSGLGQGLFSSALGGQSGGGGGLQLMPLNPTPYGRI